MSPYGLFRGRLEFTHFKVYLNTFTFILIRLKILKFNKYYINFRILVVEKVVEMCFQLPFYEDMSIIVINK